MCPTPNMTPYLAFFHILILLLQCEDTCYLPQDNPFLKVDSSVWSAVEGRQDAPTSSVPPAGILVNYLHLQRAVCDSTFS